MDVGRRRPRRLSVAPTWLWPRIGRHTFRVVATSRDGLTHAVTVTYTVLAPSNSFRIRNLKPHADGTVSFTVIVPGPGTIDVLETAPTRSLGGAGGASAGPQQPGPGRFVFARGHFVLIHAITHLTTVPTARGMQLIVRHRGPVRVSMWITYTPSGGYSHTIARFNLLVVK